MYAFLFYRIFRFYFNVNTKEFAAERHESYIIIKLKNSTLRNRHYKVAVQKTTTQNSSFSARLSPLLGCLPCSFLSVRWHTFRCFSHICTSSGWRRTWAVNSDTAASEGYPLMLLESISYYLGWGFVTRNNVAILCQLFQVVGLKLMVHTEAFAFLTRIVIWPSRIWSQ